MKGVPGFQGDRLNQQREMRRMSVGQLAEHVGLSPQAISKYERNASAPTAENLSKLAAVLQIPVNLLLTPAQQIDSTLFFRSRSAASQGSRKLARHQAHLMAEAVGVLMEHVQFPPVNLPLLSVDVVSLPDSEAKPVVEQQAERLRSTWGLGEGPIRQLIPVMEANGILVAQPEMDEAHLDAFSMKVEQRPIVLLNGDRSSAVRLRFSAAHELAHLTLHDGVKRNFLEEKLTFERIEQQANWFASALLLPRQTFPRDVRIPSLDALLALKQKWGVSVGAMIQRLHTLGRISDSTKQDLWMAMSRRGWRTREPLDDVLPVERPSMLRQAFEVPRKVGIRPEEATALPREDLERLCGLPPGFLQGTDLVPRVQLKTEKPTR